MRSTRPLELRRRASRISSVCVVTSKRGRSSFSSGRALRQRLTRRLGGILPTLLASTACRAPRILWLSFSSVPASTRRGIGAYMRCSERGKTRYAFLDSYAEIIERPLPAVRALGVFDARGELVRGRGPVPLFQTPQVRAVLKSAALGAGRVRETIVPCGRLPLTGDRAERRMGSLSPRVAESQASARQATSRAHWRSPSSPARPPRITGGDGWRSIRKMTTR